MISKDKILLDLHNLGVKKGDVLFLRISYRSVGKIEGGPSALIDLLLEAVGEEGLLIFAAFAKKYLSFAKILYRSKVYSNINKPTPITGILPKIALLRKDAHYSQNPIYPFILIGRDAERLANKYNSDYGAYDLLKDISENYDAKCLRIGGQKLTGTTHIALSESLCATNNYQKKIDKGYFFNKNNTTKWFRATSSAFCYDALLELYGEKINDNRIFKTGKIGKGNAALSKMIETLNFERSQLLDNSKKLLCSNPRCLTCRVSFSHSDSTNKFYKLLLKDLMRFRSFSTLRKMLLLFLFGSKHT